MTTTAKEATTTMMMMMMMTMAMIRTARMAVAKEMPIMIPNFPLHVPKSFAFDAPFLW